MYDVLIIGCGVTGAAAAYELSRYQLKVCILEAANDVAMGASKANSAIIHAGYDPAPGTLMAKLNVEGCAMAEELCKKLDVPYAKVGSMVVAFTEADEAHIQKLYERGVANGVPDLAIIDGEAARELEPNLAEGVRAALLAPSAGVISPWEYTLAMAEVAVENGVKLHLNTKVTAIEKTENGFAVTAENGRTFETRYIINAAGVYADKVHELVGEKEFTINPTRGEYYLLDKTEGTRVGRTIFQCPNELGKGVLVSPTVHGNLIVGPNAEPGSGHDNTATTAEGLGFVKKMAALSVPSVNVRENIRDLPRFGLELCLPDSFDHVKYYGFGPGQNDRDMRESAKLGIWESDIDGLQVPYIKPQENGARMDTRWLHLSGDQHTLQICAVGEHRFMFSASHNTVEEVEAVRSYPQLAPRAETVLYLDYAQNGVGSAACGPTLPPEHSFSEKAFSYSFELRFL